VKDAVVTKVRFEAKQEWLLVQKSEYVRNEFLKSGNPRPLKDSERQIIILIVVCDRSLGEKQKYFSSSVNGTALQLRNAAR